MCRSKSQERMEEKLINSLTRFEIETLLAYDYVGRQMDAAGALLHISYHCVHRDLYQVRKKTGLNPTVKDECDTLLAAIENKRKEMDNGRGLYQGRDYFE